ncbi:MAG: 4-demethylwyosine synthase TYW1 [archaeon]|nr:4-demethylwyosine synthase TYW1 [archaeon]
MPIKLEIADDLSGQASCSPAAQEYDGAESNYDSQKASGKSPGEETKFLSKKQVEKLKRAQYAMVGSHSAVQICSWNKKSIRQQGVCYKQKFYGIECDRCAQMSPTVLWCNENCVFCWRPMEWMRNVNLEDVEVDEPEKIIKGTISQRNMLLTGYGGLPGINKPRFERAKLPSHWAISLSGEPTLYPKICELISEIKSLPETKSVFLVTNAQKTEVFEKMATNPNYLPTQLYVSLDAPNEEQFDQINRASHKNGWQRLMKSMEFISNLNTRKVVRITLIKNLNDDVAFMKDWSEVVWKMKPEFLEIKSYMHIGDSRSRLSRENMPTFEEVEDWSKKFVQASGYFYKDFSKPSRITLLVRPDLKDRNTKIEFARNELGLQGEGIDF